MAALAEAFVSVRADTTKVRSDVEKGVSKVDGKRLGGSIGANLGSGMRVGLSGPLKAIGGLMVGAFAVVKSAQVFSGFINDARESAKVSRITANAIKVTGGAAKITADQVGALATAISNKTGIDDEQIQTASNMLLCLEDTAQALTRDRGWVTHDQLKPGDEVLTYDPATDTSQWDPILDFYRYEVDTELVHWKSKQIDVKTTPHHRWWTIGQNDRSSYRPQFSTTEEITGKQIRVKIGGGIGEGFAGEPVMSDDIVELAGWMITEGTARWVRPSTPQSTQCQFGQSETANPDKVKRIRALVDRLRFAGHVITERSDVMPYNESTYVTWYFAHDLGRTLRRWLPNKGLTMEFITALTRPQAELLLDTLIDGDGHTDKHGRRQYVQKDKGQLDLLAGLCAMLGVRTTDVPSRSTAGSLYLNATNHAYGHAMNAERVRYQGVVWCPQVRTGIFMARNRGRTFWTGNTFKNIRNEAGKNNDIFNRATQAVADLSVQFGGTDAASKQLGKALNDPVKGIAALNKAGVTFTEQQKKQIKTLVESGDVLGAQKIILKEVEGQVGGAAAAAADPMQRLQVVVGNLGESLGGLLLPVVNKVANFVSDTFVPGIYALGAAFKDPDVTSDGFVGFMERVGVGARFAFDYFKTNVLPRLREFAGFVRDEVVPRLKDFAVYIRDTVIPIVVQLAKQWLARLQDAFNKIRNAIQENRPQLTQIFHGLQDVAKVVIEKVIPFLARLSANTFPILVGVITTGIRIVGKLVEAFNAIKTPVFNAIKFITQKFLGFVGAVLTGAAKAFGWVPGLGGKLKTAAADFEQFKKDVNKSLDGIDDEAIKVALKYTAKGINLTAPSSVGRKAAGGGIHGPGTGTSDTAGLYALSNNEHVVTAREVMGAGGHAVVEATRRMWAKGMKTGGRVLAINTDLPSHAYVNAVSSAVARQAGLDIARSTPALGAAGPPGAVRSFRGQTLNERTIRMLLSAEQMLGSAFRILQGSYSTRVAASGGTHAGGGAMDTDGPRGWSTAVTALRRAGFAAWHRTPAQGPWGHHIHSIAIGDPTASPAAKRQVQSFLRGGDGLGGGTRFGSRVQSFDRGGWLMPGLSLAHNGTGRPEQVRTAEQDAAPVELSDSSIRRLAKAFASQPLRVVDRRGQTFATLLPSGG